jgi:hypothetical protein
VKQINKTLNYLSCYSTRIFFLLRVECSSDRAKLPDDLSPVGIPDRIIFCHGRGTVVSLLIGCLIASLTSSHLVPLAVSGRDSKKCLQILSNVPWEEEIKIALALGDRGSRNIDAGIYRCTRVV